MPIYEYQCDKCGRIEEAIQKFSDRPLTQCGHCSGKLNKLISHSTFHLKGTGWYVTDYAGKTKKKIGESGPSSAKSPASGEKTSATTSAQKKDD